MHERTFTIPSSLSLSRSSSFAQMDNSQGPSLKRTDLGSCTLGTKGNLRFTEVGATAPASRAGVLLSEMRRSLADRCTNLKAYFTRESPEARAQREELLKARVEVRVNSRYIGDLLGSLTVKVDEEGRFVKARDCSRIVRALIALNAPATGDLYSLKGAKYCLDTYLKELSEFELVALTHGVLSSEAACKAVLDKISIRPDDALRMQMSRLLGDIAKAVNQEVSRYKVYNWSRIVDVQTADPENEQDLRAHLMTLTDGRQFDNLENFSRDEFKTLLGALDFQKIHAVQQALQHKGYCAEASRLGLLAERVGTEFVLNRAPSLYNARSLLWSALIAGNGPAVSDALRGLSLAVEASYQDWQTLPYPTVVELQNLVDRSMILLRDHQNNPTGPLNWHSLSKLDDGLRKNLGDAAQVLWAFGLELDPALRAW